MLLTRSSFRLSVILNMLKTANSLKNYEERNMVLGDIIMIKNITKEKKENKSGTNSTPKKQHNEII